MYSAELALFRETPCKGRKLLSNSRILAKTENGSHGGQSHQAVKIAQHCLAPLYRSKFLIIMW